jgi:hypothetical protein
MTVRINTQEELEALIDKNNIIIYDDLEINCDIHIIAHIKAYNIRAKNIKAWDINAWDIKARDIKAENINVYNINANGIEAYSVKARRDIKSTNIKVKGSIEACNIETFFDINAKRINATNIKACNIIYLISCIAIKSLKCKTIRGRRKNSLQACLDQPIEYIK